MSVSPDPAQTHFGFSTVPLGDKQDMVNDVFFKVAAKYDLMNDLMSGGLHRIWKDILVGMAKPRRAGVYAHLDVAGGTGDIATRIVRAAGREARATVCDVNAEMLAVGAERARKRKLAEQIDFVEGNAEDLPFASGRFDLYTIAFGIRNVPRPERALAEAYRTLRRGGRFLCLEFSTVDAPLLGRLYEAYSFAAIPAIGKVVTGDGRPYRYLVELIRKFPNPERFRLMIEEAGFRRASFTRLSGGIVAIHSGWKL